MSDKKSSSSAEADFQPLEGELATVPFATPNLVDGREFAFLHQTFAAGWNVITIGAGLALLCLLANVYALAAKTVGPILVCGVLVLLVLVLAWTRVTLIDQAHYGVACEDGRWRLLPPGWHVLRGLWSSFGYPAPIANDLLRAGTITLVRIPQGHLGLAMDNSQPLLLLPGQHYRNSAAFVFCEVVSATSPLIQLGPIKLITVPAGTNRICLKQGKAVILTPGRYGVNNANFQVLKEVSITEQSLPFTGHQVLLEGGVHMTIRGLLAYQISNLAKLLNQIAEGDLKKFIEDVTEAELTRIFSRLHLEQLVSSSNSSSSQEERKVDEKQQQSLLGDKEDVRAGICEAVLQAVRPRIESWGVTVIHFQLLETNLTNKEYAVRYEQSSLDWAKAKAERHKVQTENETKMAQARGEADARLTEAKAQAERNVVLAESLAKAKLIEAKAAQAAAELLSSNPLAQELARQAVQVEVAKHLRARSITVVGDVAHPLQAVAALKTLS